MKSLLTISLSILAVSASHGALVTADGVMTSTTADFRSIGRILLTDGMVDNGAPGLTIDDGAGDDFDSSWITKNDGGADYIDGKGPVTLTFTFTTAQDDVGGIAVWSYSHGDANARKNSISAGTVQFFNAGDVSLGAAQAFTSGASNASGYLTSFGTDYDGVAKAVVTITDNHYDGGAGGDRVASAHIAFDIIPEPSVSLLGALGILGLLRRRR